MTPTEFAFNRLIEKKKPEVMAFFNKVVDRVIYEAGGPYTDEQKTQKHLDEYPGDFDTRLVLADLYEESGRTGLAQVQRWLVKHEKYPYFSPSLYNQHWFWWEGLYPYQEHAQLPKKVHSILYHNHYEKKTEACFNKSRQAIEDALLPVLLQLGEIEEGE